MSRSNKKSKSLTSTSAAMALDPALVGTAPAAFASVRAEIEAIPADEVVRINVDVPRAARCGLVAADNVEPFLAELADLGRFDVRPVRKLRLYSLALLHAHDLATEAGSELPPLPVLVAEAAPLREGLLRTAELLAHYGLVSAERVAAIRSGTGYADMAGDLSALGRMFDELWLQVHDKIVAKREDVDRAVALSAQLQKALALHEAEQSPVTRHKGRRHLRAQAYTLFCRAYEETRRGVAFLRWYEDDAQRIVPTLRPRKLRRPGAEELEEAGDDLVDPNRMDDGEEPVLEIEPPSVAAANDLVANA